MELFPHERSLVQRYEQRPFALLGVNLDFTRESLRRTEDKEHLNWRSWWDGPQGPIAEKWQVGSLPLLFLIDHHGVIRYESQGVVPRPQELEKRIEELLREAESATVVSRQ
jgi:hypothetical protein